MTSIFWISWEVRKPSKKWQKGTLDSMVARWATRAMSMHSWTGAGAKESKTGLARGHHVLLVAEDAQRVRGKGTGGNVEYGGKQFTGDFVHVGVISRRP